MFVIKDTNMNFMLNLIDWGIYNNFVWSLKPMNLSEPAYQLKSEEIIIRDTAELYLKVEQNTEFLTNLIRHQTGRHLTPYSIQIPQIQIRSFFNAIVQVSYLMYTCTIRKVALLLSRQTFLIGNRQNPEIIFEFLLEKQMMNMSEEKQKYFKKFFFYINPYKYENSYAGYLFDFIKNTLDVMKSYIEKHKDKKVLGDKVLARQLENLVYTIGLLEPQIKNGLKPKTLISCLEETQVFRVYSGLLKTLNCSIYESLRKTSKLKQIIGQIKRQQAKLQQNLNDIRMNTKPTKEQEQIMEMQIQQFFRYLYGLKLVTFDSQVSADMSDKSFSMKNVQVNKDGERMIRYCIKVSTKPFRNLTQQLISQIDTGELYKDIETDKKNYSTFEIDFYLSRRMFSVKYIAEVQINAENTDALMYHCNNMMTQWQNVSVEQIEKKRPDSKKKDKLFAFKVISLFHPKDTPFITILLSIDMAMIYGKISEPEINQKIIRLDDQRRFIQTGKKIEHLINLFIKKIRRLYENLSQKV